MGDCLFEQDIIVEGDPYGRLQLSHNPTEECITIIVKSHNKLAHT